MPQPEPVRPAQSSSLVIDRRGLLTRSAALASSVAAFGAPAVAVRAQDSTLTIASNWTPADLDPHSGYDPGSGLMLCGIYEGLLRQTGDSGAQLEPCLAESWSANADSSVWTFLLRSGVTFQDGTPLTAEAAQASFVRQMTLNRAPANVLNRFVSSPDQIVAVDERTLRFDLDRSWPRFDVALAAPSGASIMNVAVAMAHDVDGDLGLGWCQTNAEGLGTGPYRLTELEPQSHATLERYDGYWGGRNDPHFDRVIIRVVVESETRRELLEQGEVDLVENIGLDSVADLEQNPDLVVDRQTLMTVRYLAITQTEPFTQPEARQALCWAFPYDEVLSGVFLGTAKPAYGAVSPNTYGFSPPSPAFTTDLDKARGLLASAGIPEGTRIWTVVNSGNISLQSVAELFQYNLQQIGIQLDIVDMDYGTFVAMIFGDQPAEERPTLLPIFWDPDYDDAWSQLWPMASCDAWNSGNGGHYCNERVDELLQAANDAPDEDACLAALAEAQQITGYDDPVSIYFALPEWITVLRADIGGFQVHPIVGSYLDYYAMFRKP